jgi:DNA-directed RNA polymerase sigma subunit (sigma70/sigma32)
VAVGPYSHAVQAGEFFYLSGQTPLDSATGKLVEGDIAAQKFDETRGFKFISYAVWWIRQSILQAIAEQSRVVRLPLNQVGSVNKIKRILNKFEQENERRPSIDEIAEKTDMPHEAVEREESVALLRYV